MPLSPYAGDKRPSVLAKPNAAVGVALLSFDSGAADLIISPATDESQVSLCSPNCCSWLTVTLLLLLLNVIASLGQLLIWVTSFHVDSKSRDGMPNSAYPNPFNMILYFGNWHARIVSMIIVRRFSIDSTLSRITKSSPTPTVKTKASVYLAASLVKSPAGVAYAKTCKSGYFSRNRAPANVAIPAPKLCPVSTNLYSVYVLKALSSICVSLSRFSKISAPAIMPRCAAESGGKPGASNRSEFAVRSVKMSRKEKLPRIETTILFVAWSARTQNGSCGDISNLNKWL